MLGVAVYVVEALRRLGSPVEVESTAMLVVGALGLAVNVVAILLLRGGAEESLNVRGAYLEVIADAAGSVGVIVAGVLVSRTGEPLWDTLVALAIGIFVAVRASGSGARSSRSWASTCPQGLSRSPRQPDLRPDRGRQRRARPARVTLTSGMHVAHLVSAPGADVQQILGDGQTLLRERHDIAHATLQVEPATGEGCSDAAGE